MITSQTKTASGSRYVPVIDPATATVEEMDEWIVAQGGRPLSPQELKDFVARIVAHRPLSSDPDDDSLLELAFTADVDCVVTFNKSHLRPARDMGIDLLTPSELLQQLRQ